MCAPKPATKAWSGFGMDTIGATAVVFIGGIVYLVVVSLFSVILFFFWVLLMFWLDCF